MADLHMRLEAERRQAKLLGVEKGAAEERLAAALAREQGLRKVGGRPGWLTAVLGGGRGGIGRALLLHWPGAVHERGSGLDMQCARVRQVACRGSAARPSG